jgi:hypothetical protein
MIYSQWVKQFKVKKSKTLPSLKAQLRKAYARIDEPELKRKRNRLHYERPNYEDSTWGRMLKDPKSQDPKTREGKLFMARFRVPFPKYLEMVAFVDANDVRINGVTGKRINAVDSAGKSTVPVELLVLGVLRVLGRGISFDGIFELNGISTDINRIFFHQFCSCYARVQFPISCAPPQVGPDLDRVLQSYADLGLSGCCGSTDCTHVHWDRCPAGLRHSHVGKEGFPTLSYSVTCTHSRRIIACTSGFTGSTNDKTISRFDEFLIKIKNGDLYGHLNFDLRNCVDDTVEKMVGLYLICDGGYLKQKSMQCPVKHTSDADLCHWSRWVESVRKDIECTFGVLKGRFRILKLPCLLKEKDEIDNVFWTCCALHNEIMRDDNWTKLWEAGYEWNKDDGNHDLCDIDKRLFLSRRTFDERGQEIYRKVMVRVTAKLDLGKFASGAARGGGSFYSDPEDVIDNLPQVGHEQLRNKLVDHFKRQWKEKLLMWH